MPLRILRNSGTTSERARMDSTALLIAKWVELGTGETQMVAETIGKFIEDPERLASVTLALLNLCSQYACQSGRNPNGLKDLIDFLIYQMEKANA